MKRKLITVTVGIAAHNEERNIGLLLGSVLKQRQSGWKLLEILVYTDACDDRTEEVVRSVVDTRIRLVSDRAHKGKVHRVNQMTHAMRGDIFVLFDADLIIRGTNVITALVRAITSDENVVLAGGNTRPLPPRTFIERSVYATFTVFERSRKYLRGGHNIFGCNGGCIAIRKDFAKHIRIPNVINEDDYLYFSARSGGYGFRHVPPAVVMYRLPQTLQDYLKQSFRSNPDAVTLNFSKYFGPLVATEYSRPIPFMIKSVAQAFIRYPLETAFITVLNLFMKPFYSVISTRYKLEWYSAKTTK